MDAIGFTYGTTHVSLWTVLVVVVVFIGVVIIARLFTLLLHRTLRKVTTLDTTQKLLTEKLLGILVWTLTILIGIDILGISLTALTVFSGAFGLAIGFGLQKTFGNLLAGIILLMDRSIKPGDVIAVSDQAGNLVFGEIRKIGIRAVSLTTRDEREYLIPNENLMVNQVENWSYSSRRVRVQVPVAVSYDCDLKLAETLMIDAARAVPRILAEPAPVAWIDRFGEIGVNFVIQCWINDPEEGTGNLKSAVLKTLWWKFKEHGIEIPHAQRPIAPPAARPVDRPDNSQ
jgi:small-conductance mechanosensitive channel